MHKYSVHMMALGDWMNRSLMIICYKGVRLEH